MKRASAIVVVLVIATLATPSGAYTRPATTQRISVTSAGAQANGPSAGGEWSRQTLVMTSDARYVAFSSDASNLVAGDANGEPVNPTVTAPPGRDVFVRDRVKGTVERVSIASDGTEGNVNVVEQLARPNRCDGADLPAISGDGRYVAFASCFDNLVAGDTNRLDDIFLHDRNTGQTIRVSVGPSGAQADRPSTSPAVSADGRYVAFESAATNLLQGQVVLAQQIYVYDAVTQTVRAASVNSTGTVGNGPSWETAISADGREVAFTTTSNNLGSCDTCPPPQTNDSSGYLYLHSMSSGQTRPVTLSGPRGTPGTAGHPCCGSSRAQRFSADGRYLVFEGDGKYVPNMSVANGAVNPGPQALVYDRKTGRVARVSVDSTGSGLWNSDVAAISANGRYVTFVTGAGPAGCGPGVVVHDRVTGASEYATANCTSGGVGGRLQLAPKVSADGRFIAFASADPNVVRDDTNKTFDVFMRDRGTALGVERLTVAGRRGFAFVGDPTSDVAPALTAQGANLIGVTLAYRPQLNDLFIRLEVETMPSFALANPSLIYAVRFTADNARFEVRAIRTGIDASFGLFREAPGGWVQVATLRGGYGTTGPEIVVAVPLAVLGTQRGGRLSQITATTGLGNYTTGPTQRIDAATVGEAS